MPLAIDLFCGLGGWTNSSEWPPAAEGHAHRKRDRGEMLPDGQHSTPFFFRTRSSMNIATRRRPAIVAAVLRAWSENFTCLPRKMLRRRRPCHFIESTSFAARSKSAARQFTNCSPAAHCGPRNAGASRSSQTRLSGRRAYPTTSRRIRPKAVPCSGVNNAQCLKMRNACPVG